MVRSSRVLLVVPRTGSRSYPHSFCALVHCVCHPCAHAIFPFPPARTALLAHHGFVRLPSCLLKPTVRDTGRVVYARVRVRACVCWLARVCLVCALVASVLAWGRVRLLCFGRVAWSVGALAARCAVFRSCAEYFGWVSLRAGLFLCAWSEKELFTLAFVFHTEIDMPNVPAFPD